jgi:hypothetical protein
MMQMYHGYGLVSPARWRSRSLTWEAIGASFAGGAIAAVAGEPWLQGLQLWWGDRPPAYPTSRGLRTPRPPRLRT